MWIALAFGSAFFAGLTSVFAKIGIKKTDSNLATAIRTIVVLIMAWIIVLVTGAYNLIGGINAKSWIFLVMSGFATGASWICYFKALQAGDINKVNPIDKTSVFLTMLIAILFLGESVTPFKIAGMFLILTGTILMVIKFTKPQTIQQASVNETLTLPPAVITNKEEKTFLKRNVWLLFAVLSAVFASLTSILAKIGIENVNSNLATALRTVVVVFFAWLIVFAAKKHRDIKQIDKKSWIYLIVSGVCTGLSWLCFYKALQLGQVSVVVPIDKLSILVSVIFSAVILKEKLSVPAIIGLIVMTAGTVLLLF